MTPALVTPAALRALVERVAREAGAGDVKIAPAGDDAATRARFAASIERGDLSTWPYDAAYAEKAASPQALLADARSVICVAIPYPTRAPRGRGPLTGRISNYAWSTNYHRHVRAVLQRIADALDAAAGSPVTCVACDTAPLAERAFAERSGLGWIGKHTNLISPELGSFVFLGEIVTTLELPPDAPSKKACGSCTRLHRGLSHRRLARRLFDGRNALHLRSHPAHRCDSTRSPPVDRRLGLGLRSLPRSLSADAPRLTARRCGVRAVECERGLSRPACVAAHARRRTQAALSANGDGLARCGRLAAQRGRRARQRAGSRGRAGARNCRERGCEPARAWPRRLGARPDRFAASFRSAQERSRE